MPQQADRRRSSTKSGSSKSDQSSPAQRPISGPEDPGLSFIFIVNEVVANDDPDTHGVLPRNENGGRWAPPIYAQGFYRQTEGKVYRWKNGDVTRLENYRWHAMYIEPTETDEAANGVVMDPYARPLTRYRSATVFYANPFTKFRTAPGDATARNLYDQGEIWHNLRFHHTGPNISLVDHAGEEDYLVGNNTRCSWHKQLVPQAYECQENNEESGGLAGLLPILIALVAFSCKASELDDVLRRGRSWRNRNWVRHSYSNGRREKRGLIVTAYLDPDNPHGSTPEALSSYENAEDGRPVFR